LTLVKSTSLELSDAEEQRVAGSDFHRGPESFTERRKFHRRAGNVGWFSPSAGGISGEKTNDSGDATHANVTRGGSPQDV
jgi:hypothetical protein